MASIGVAIVLVDPVNDFLDPQGKLYPMVKESLTPSQTVENISKVLRAARRAKIPIYYGLHKHYEDRVYDGWKHMRASNHRILKYHAFAGWGGEVMDDFAPSRANDDVLASRHWNNSSFRNTDLDYLLRQREITHLIMAGMVANTCLESTARDGTELGYKVTLITDGTAELSVPLYNAAANVIWPTIVEEVLTTDEWISRVESNSEANI